MQADTPPKGGGRDGPSQWGTADASDQQQPEDSGLVQSLRFYVAHANAGNRGMSESPLASDIFRYSPESRTAAAAALAAEKEDRLLHLVRGYGCAVILANLITTFIFSMALMFFIGTNTPVDSEAFPKSFALTSNIEIVPAGPATNLEEALAHPRSVLITAFDSGGFSVVYRHDVIGWEASRARSSATLFLSASRRLVVTSTTILFEDSLTGLRLAEWELWDKEADNSPHKVLRDALHARGDGRTPAGPPVGTGEGDSPLARIPHPPDQSGDLPSRRLSDGSGVPMTTHARQFTSAAQHVAALPTAQMVHAQARERARLLGALPYISW